MIGEENLMEDYFLKVKEMQCYNGTHTHTYIYTRYIMVHKILSNDGNGSCVQMKLFLRITKSFISMQLYILNVNFFWGLARNERKLRDRDN
jgi:hypothetical protein